MDFNEAEIMAQQECNKIYRFIRATVNEEFSDEWAIRQATMAACNVLRVLSSKRLGKLACLCVDKTWYSCYEEGWEFRDNRPHLYMPAGYQDWRMAVVVNLQPEIYISDNEKAVRLKQSLNRCPLRSVALAAYLKRQIDEE